MLATLNASNLYERFNQEEVAMKVRRVSDASCLLLSLTIFSVSPATAAQSAPTGDQLAAIRAACAEDAQKFCSTVQPGGGRIVACLKEHKDSLSDKCRQAAGLPPKPSNSAAPGGASSPSTPPADAAPPSAPPADSHTKPTPPTKATAPVAILGERFVQRSVIDTQQGGMTAVTVHVPENWHFEGKIEWHYGWIEVPVNPSWHAENPANAEAYFQYESLRLINVDVAPQYRQYVKPAKPGDRSPTGQINFAPVPPLQAMVTFIKKVRADATNLKWLGQQDLPDLAKALRLAPSPNQHGVAIKIGYDLDGKPVEETFFGVYYLNKAGTQGAQLGQIKMAANSLVQTNWGFQALQSFRAPAGTLDKRMPVYCVIAKSVQYDPQWTLRYRAINATLLQMFNQKLQQGWDQLRAAQAISDQTMRDQQAFQANFDRQERAMMRDSGGGNSVDGFLRTDDSGGGGGGGARSSSDRVSDLLRNVDTMNDPSTGGTKEVSNLGGYNHFTDGFGNYRSYDSPSATPENQGENGSWTRMTEAP
jgi:Cysteine rich repeat